MSEGRDVRILEISTASVDPSPRARAESRSRRTQSRLTTNLLRFLVSWVTTGTLIALIFVAGVRGILELPAPQYRSSHPTL